MTNESNDKVSAKKKVRKEWKRVSSLQSFETKPPRRGSRKLSAPVIPVSVLSQLAVIPDVDDTGPNVENIDENKENNNDNNDSDAKDNSNVNSSGTLTSVVRARSLVNNKRKQLKRCNTQPLPLIQEPVSEDEEDPVAVHRINTLQVIRSAFDLVIGEDCHLKINVDNVCPLLRSLGLNPKDELVMDMVRDACMESTGDIEPRQLEEVVMTLVKRLDEDLWTKRLEEKEDKRHEYEAKKARIEADKLKKAEARRKAGFDDDDEEEEDEWQQYEKQRQEEEKRKLEEKKCDELYDNIKMAFRFIDADGDGVITTKDLYTLMMGLGEMMTDDDLFGMFTMADIDCDGKVTYDDFTRFLMTEEERNKLNEEEAKQAENNDTKDGEQVNEDEPHKEAAEATDCKQEEVKSAAAQDKEVKSPIPDATSSNLPVVTPTPPVVAKDPALARRQSILRGYTSPVKPVQLPKPEPEVKSPPSNETPLASIGESSPVPSVVVPSIETPTPSVEVIAEEPDQTEDGVDCTDSHNHLIAIREEDEHSNYEFQYNDKSDDNEVAKITATTVSLALENKRKHFTRQGSSASLKTRPNSAITTESVCDSGIDTMDNLYGSEIREQPDIFDLSDEEGLGEVHNNTPCGSLVRLNSKSPHEGVYEMNEDDEDMVDSRHVQESLSRVSSPGLSDINDDLNNTLKVEVRKSSSQDSGIVIERLDLKEDDSDNVHKSAQLSDERMAKAKNLQKLISARSARSPRTTRYTSRLSPKVDKSELPVPVCSQIDINLTCDAPPNADVKSRRRRIKSAKARSTVNGNSSYVHEKSEQDPTVSVIEVGNGIEDQPPGHIDLPRFPSRPLIRPRSPRKPISARTIKGRLDVERLSVDVRPLEFTESKPKRAQSAVPFLRSKSSPQILVRARQRPQTANANLTYTGSRRMEEAFSKLKTDSADAKFIHPRVEQEYPNKAVLTTLHHGFKTFWPIGRNVNVLKEKRPFQAFELNSYSRSIERNAFPFKGVPTNSAVGKSVDSKDPRRLPEVGLIQVTSQNTKQLQLDLDINGPHRPIIRSRSALGGRRTPHTAR